MTTRVKFSPSVLSADFANLGKQVQEAEAAGADYIHVDVMDGHFVPNLTVGPLIVQALRTVTQLPLDVHLMVEEPERWVPEFAAAGASILTVHAEATPHLHRAIQYIKERGMKAGISLNPSTSPIALEEVLPFLDLVLIMSVNPGFGGQSFIQTAIPKIQRVRAMLDAIGSNADLAVDGGVNAETAVSVVRAGADVLVAGAAIYNKQETVAQAISRLRASLTRE